MHSSLKVEQTSAVQQSTFSTHKDHDFISNNYKSLIKISDTEYIHKTSVNEQDKVDIKEILELEKIAKIREKEGVTRDEQFLLEDDEFLLPEEIK